MEKMKVYFFTDVTPNRQYLLEVAFSMQWWNYFTNLLDFIRENANSGITTARKKIPIFSKFWLTACHRMMKETSHFGIFANTLKQKINENLCLVHRTICSLEIFLFISYLYDSTGRNLLKKIKVQKRKDQNKK